MAEKQGKESTAMENSGTRPALREVCGLLIDLLRKVSGRNGRIHCTRIKKCLRGESLPSISEMEQASERVQTGSEKGKETVESVSDSSISWPEERWPEMNSVKASIAGFLETLKKLSPHHQLLERADIVAFNKRYLGKRSWNECEFDEVLRALMDFRDILSVAIEVERLYICRRFTRPF